MRVCEQGRLKVKRTSDVSGANFRLAERIADKKDCTWYGQAFCHGDEVIVSHSFIYHLLLFKELDNNVYLISHAVVRLICMHFMI